MKKNNYYIKEVPYETLYSSYKMNDLCPNCYRVIPSKKHLRKNGCKYCVPLKNTPYCDGRY